MANEFVTRNGFISLDNSQITGSLKVTQGVTASLFGTSSWAQNATTSSYIVQAVSASFATTASYTLNISGSTNYIPKFTSNSVIGNSIIFDNGTSVGIGTASPTFKLDVNGDASFNTVQVGLGGGSISDNVIVGYRPLYNNTSGTKNTSMGYFSNYWNSDGSYNSSFGYYALNDNTTGNYNTAIGASALQTMVSGVNNTALGYGAGISVVGGANNSTSNNSVYLGYETKPTANGNTNEIVIGYQTEGNGSNTVTLGNTSITRTILRGRVEATSFTGSLSGIATTASLAFTASSADTFVIRQNATASNILVNNTLTAQTLVVQTVTSSIVYSSGSNIFGNQLTNVQQFTGSLRVTGSGDHFVVGGNVGINTTSPLVKLDVVGDVRSSTKYLWGTATNGTTGQIATDNTNNYFDYLGNLYFRGAPASNTLVTFLSNGNVGINTTSPAYRFDVQVASNKHWAIAASATGEASFRAGDDGYLNFAVGEIDASTLRLNSQSGGNVGINTTSPIYKLDVNGTGNFSNNLTLTGSLISSGNTATARSVVLAASGGFSKSFAIVNNRNIGTGDTGSFHIWRCNVPCTASAVSVYFDAGTNVVVNASKNASNDLLAANFTNSTADSWQSTTSLQNQNFNVNDTLQVNFVSFSGSPKEVTIQVNFTY